MLRRLRNALAYWRSRPASEGFSPKNELEQRLYHAQRGDVSVHAFLSELQRSQVIALFDGPSLPEDGDRSTSMPLMLANDNGVTLLAIFTSVERIQPWRNQVQPHCYVLTCGLDWLLLGLAPSAGLVINPGSTYGLEISPAGVAEFKAAAGWA